MLQIAKDQLWAPKDLTDWGDHGFSDVLALGCCEFIDCPLGRLPTQPYTRLLLVPIQAEAEHSALVLVFFCLSL